jgi:PAS domain S-box-containing protein
MAFRDKAPRRSINILLAVLILGILYLASRENYLFFHVLAEMFGVVIAFGIFLFAWNTRHIIDNTYLLFLGIAYPFVGTVDLVHTISYRGMGIFPGDTANLATQLWIAARYLQAVSLLAAALLVRRRPRTDGVLAVYAVITGGILILILRTGLFPDCFVEGTGLTGFKILSEYIICSFLMVSLVLLYRLRDQFETYVYRLLLGSIAATIVSELSFTFYRDPYGIPNLFGHYLKIVAFYLLYKAIIETGLTKPFTLMFHRLGRHEEQLQQKASIIDQTHDSIVTTDEKRCVISWNRGAERMFGYTAEEALGKDVSFIYARGMPQVLDRQTMKYVEEEGEHEFEERMQKKSGEEFWAHVSLSLLRGGKDRFSGTIKYIIDITPRKEAEDALNAEKEFTDATLNAQSDTFFVFDPSIGTAVRWNKAFSILSGYSDDEIREMRAPDSYYSDEDLQKARGAIEEIHQSGVTTVELSLITKDGKSIATEYTASALRDSEGKVKYIIAIGRDISQRKHEEEERTRLEKLKDQFVRMASHDLKNPLMAVNGLAGLVQDLCPPGSEMTEEAADCLKRIKRSTEIMYSIILDFLDFRAIEDGHLRLNIQPVSLGEIARDVVKMNRQYANGKKIKMEVRCAENLPRVSADPDRARQVIENLVNNAIKFSPREASIHVRCQRDNGWVALEVVDSGPGLTEEDLKNVFKKYSRMKNRPTGGEISVGLGLAISRELTELQGGEIGVRNNPDHGCTFWIRMPVVDFAKKLPKEEPADTENTSVQRAH